MITKLIIFKAPLHNLLLNMATINNCLLSLKTIYGSPISTSLSKTITLFHPRLSSPLRYTSTTRNLVLPGVASVSYPLIDTQYLESEFSGHGVTFAEVNDSSCVVRMALENGSIANLMLPSGLITSYKAQMWHESTLELLHTTVSKGENGSPFIQGGVSLACNCENDEGLSWSPNSWAVQEVEGDPQESIQVKLISRSLDGKIEANYIVTLHQDLLTSEIIVFNLGTSRLRMMGSVLSHLTVSTPEASYAVGLEGSDFFNRPPILATFSILPPGFGKIKNQTSKKFWDPKSLLSSWSTKNQNPDDAERIARETKEGLDGEETDNYKHLTDELSKIYKNAPRNFTIMDRGRRNSVVVGRDGFKEVYMMSPGSSHEWYGKYSYICIGQAALLQPIIVESQSEWRGGQSLYNPNL